MPMGCSYSVSEIKESFSAREYLLNSITIDKYCELRTFVRFFLFLM